MANIIEPFRRVDVTEHEYHFDSIIHPGSGYCFPATPEGQPIPSNAASFADARAQVAAGTMRERGYVTYTRHYYENAVLRCDCGSNVYLDNCMTNECDRCGRLYNGSGQGLAPMSQWEPEDVYAVCGPQNQPDDY